MAAQKKKATARKVPQQVKLVETISTSMKEVNSFSTSWKALALGGIVVLVLATAVFNKKWFLAAVVDNQPIFTWQLNSTLQTRFGTRILDQMIDQILIIEEAKKQGVTVSDAEISQKVKEVEQQVGGQDALSKFLNLQGMTQEDLRNQLMIKDLVDKMLAKKVAVTEKEVEDFLAKNQETMPATDAASQKRMAINSLKEQKTADSFQKWYDTLKSRAKIYRFY